MRAVLRLRLARRVANVINDAKCRCQLRAVVGEGEVSVRPQKMGKFNHKTVGKLLFAGDWDNFAKVILSVLRGSFLVVILVVILQKFFKITPQWCRLN